MQQEIDNFNSVLDAYNEARANLSKITREQVAGLFKPVFDANPNLELVEWSQYTPYFNDGDSCVFGVNELILQSPDFAELESWAGENRADSYSIREIPEWSNAYAQADEIRNRLPNELLEDVFGDHVTVTINRDLTIEVNDCDHD